MKAFFLCTLTLFYTEGHSNVLMSWWFSLSLCLFMPRCLFWPENPNSESLPLAHLWPTSDMQTQINSHGKLKLNPVKHKCQWFIQGSNLEDETRTEGEKNKNNSLSLNASWWQMRIRRWLMRKWDIFWNALNKNKSLNDISVDLTFLLLTQTLDCMCLIYSRSKVTKMQTIVYVYVHCDYTPAWSCLAWIIFARLQSGQEGGRGGGMGRGLQ